MAACKEQPLLAAYHDDELGEADRAAVEAHIRDCPACAAELEALRAASHPLRQLRRVHLNESALDRLHQSFDEETTADSRFMRFGMTLGLIAASIMLIGFAWLRALPASSGGVRPVGPVVVSPMGMEPWEQTAVTLRGDPTVLPGAESDPNNRTAAVAQWMLDGLEPKLEIRRER